MTHREYLLTRIQQCENQHKDSKERESQSTGDASLAYNTIAAQSLTVKAELQAALKNYDAHHPVVDISTHQMD